MYGRLDNRYVKILFFETLIKKICCTHELEIEQTAKAKILFSLSKSCVDTQIRQGAESAMRW